MLTRDEILATYAAGPEAVVALVESLIQRVVQAEALSERVRVLELRLSKDSHKPPSSDEPTFRRRGRKSLRKPSGKKSGGQPGHPGHTLKQVERPHAVELHEAPACCAHCGDDLARVAPRTAERRQVWDLPPLALHVTEHQAQSKRCPGCGQVSRGVFPPEIREPVQYGVGVLGLGVYLRVHHLLPYGRTAELLADLLGQAPCQGTLARALEQAYQGLETLERRIHAGLRKSPVVHFDETGMRVAGVRQWLHSAGTATLTLYRIHANRGRDALNAIGVLPEYEGVAIHNAYTSYLSYPGRHGLCNAHLLRDLVAVEEATGATWAPALRALLLEIKAAASQARTEGGSQLESARVEAFRARYDQLLEAGRAAHPPRPPTGRSGRQRQSPEYNLVQRLERHAASVLAFLYDTAVPFDNNLAERDLRMAKTQQKITGGFRTVHGAEVFCRIRGYISTLRKQHLPLLATVRTVFSGTPMLPAFPA